MHIALTTETFPPEVNGVARTLEMLARGLAGRGHELEVVRPRQNRREQPRTLAGWSELLVPGAPLPGYPGLHLGLPCRGRLLRRWRARPPEVVHIATEGPLGISALCAARRLGLPVSSSFHTNFHQYGRHYGLGLLTRLGERYLRAFHARTACTLVPAPDLRDRLATGGWERVDLLGRGVDTELFQPARRCSELRLSWGAGADGPVVAYVGRLAAEKNVPLAFEAFEALRTRVPRSRLVVVGDGPLGEALRARAPDAEFVGLRRGVDLARHYASADLVLVPSLTETFCNVVTEAMASGVAVLAFDYAAARLHIEDGINGLTVPFGDRERFIAAARAVAGVPGLWRILGERARATASGLTWEAVVARFEDVLRRVASASAAGEPPGEADAFVA